MSSISRRADKGSNSGVGSGNFTCATGTSPAQLRLEPLYLHQKRYSDDDVGICTCDSSNVLWVSNPLAFPIQGLWFATACGKCQEAGATDNSATAASSSTEEKSCCCVRQNDDKHDVKQHIAVSTACKDDQSHDAPSSCCLTLSKEEEFQLIDFFDSTRTTYISRENCRESSSSSTSSPSVRSERWTRVGFSSSQRQPKRQQRFHRRGRRTRGKEEFKFRRENDEDSEAKNFETNFGWLLDKVITTIPTTSNARDDNFTDGVLYADYDDEDGDGDVDVDDDLKHTRLRRYLRYEAPVELVATEINGAAPDTDLFEPRHEECLAIAEISLQNFALLSIQRPKIENCNETWSLHSPESHTKILLPPRSVLWKFGSFLHHWRSHVSRDQQHSFVRGNSSNVETSSGHNHDNPTNDSTVSFDKLCSAVVIPPELKDLASDYLNTNTGRLVRNDTYRRIALKIRFLKKEKNESSSLSNLPSLETLDIVSNNGDREVRSKQEDLAKQHCDDEDSPPSITMEEKGGAVSDTSTSKPLEELLTIVVTTSPIKSNPSLELLEKVFESFTWGGNEFAFRCKKIIMCDGIRLQEDKHQDDNLVDSEEKKETKKEIKDEDSGGEIANDASSLTNASRIATTTTTQTPVPLCSQMSSGSSRSSSNHNTAESSCNGNDNKSQNGMNKESQPAQQHNRRPKVSKKHANVKQALRNGIATVSQAENYEEFKRCLMERCRNAASEESLFVNTKVVELKERHGYGFALREAVKHHVQTKYVIVIQHDRTFVRQCPIEECIRCMERTEEIKYIGLSMRSNLIYHDIFLSKYGRDAYDDLRAMVKRPKELRLSSATYGRHASQNIIKEIFQQITAPNVQKNVKNMCNTYLASHTYMAHEKYLSQQRQHSADEARTQLSLTPTVFWYDNVHICSTSHYSEYIFNDRYRMVAKGGFVEDKLSPIMVRQIERLGLRGGHSKFGCYLLDDCSGYFFTGHLDGGNYLTREQRLKMKQQFEHKSTSNA